MLQVRQRKSGKYDFLTREILLSLQRKVIVGELGQRLPPTERQNGPRTFSNTKPYLEQHLQFDFNCICFKKRYLYFWQNWLHISTTALVRKLSKGPF